MNKAKVIASLISLPEEFKTEELIEKLLFLEQVEKGVQEVKEGKTVPFTDIKKQFNFSLN
ncbi:hypothetical protein [Adhaeribacter terreus]|uniref:Addiction module component n=1 Tax=Adhaeribacter terreus TaxID=529703 RepID=A0ABW0EAV4_9BACT